MKQGRIIEKFVVTVISARPRHRCCSHKTRPQRLSQHCSSLSRSFTERASPAPTTLLAAWPAARDRTTGEQGIETRAGYPTNLRLSVPRGRGTCQHFQPPGCSRAVQDHSASSAGPPVGSRPEHLYPRNRGGPWTTALDLDRSTR